MVWRASGKLNFALQALVTFFSASALAASTAVLECTASATVERALLAGFRTSVTRGWKVEKASLLLHVKEGGARSSVKLALFTGAWSEREPPARLPAGMKWTEATTEKQPEGWLVIAIPLRVTQALLSGAASGLLIEGSGFVADGRQRPQFAPYLIVEGRVPSPPK